MDTFSQCAGAFAVDDPDVKDSADSAFSDVLGDEITDFIWAEGV